MIVSHNGSDNAHTTLAKWGFFVATASQLGLRDKIQSG